MRLTLNDKEIDTIQNLLLESDEKIIYKKIETQRNKKVSDKKRNATKKATQVRTDIAKQKIENEINLMQLENEPITKLKISKRSGVAYNTVLKYMKHSTIIVKNKSHFGFENDD